MPILVTCGCGRGQPARRFLATPDGEVLVCQVCFAAGVSTWGAPETDRRNQPHRPWSPGEIDQLLALFSSGVSLAQSARRLGRGYDEAQAEWKRQGLNGWERGALFRPHAIERQVLRGADRFKVARWIRNGLLPTRQVGKRHWVRREDLLAFLEDERSWMLWQPEDLLDEGLRRWAEKLRDVGWHWLTIAQASQRMHCVGRTVQHHIDLGLLPAMRHCDQRKYPWWVRSDDVDTLARHPEWWPVGGRIPGADRLIREARAAIEAARAPTHRKDKAA
jgi:hypothetical protein